MLKVFKRVEITCRVISAARFSVRTETPGGGMVERFTTTLPVTSGSGRTVIPVKFPGSITSRLFQPVIDQGSVVLYGMRVYAKRLNGPEGWAWHEIPVTPTPEEWTRVPLRIQATPDEWTRVPLRITPTPDEWSRVDIALPPAPAVHELIRIPVDAIE